MKQIIANNPRHGGEGSESVPEAKVIGGRVARMRRAELIEAIFECRCQDQRLEIGTAEAECRPILFNNHKSGCIIPSR